MKEKRKKKYEKPKIVYEKKIEVLSTVCNSNRSAFVNCTKSAPCITLLS